MRSVVKIALEVTKEQAAILDSQSKIANWLYTERGLRNLIPELKAAYPFLKAG